MHEYGFWSILPPIVAILLAIRTKQVFVSLLFGIWLGWVIINEGNLLTGTFDTIQALVNVFADAGNTRTIMFCALVGALIIFIQKSGGVEGFIIRISKILERYEAKKEGNNRVVVQFLAWLTGVLIFVESSVSVLTVGALYRPLFDKLKISREKFDKCPDCNIKKWNFRPKKTNFFSSPKKCVRFPFFSFSFIFSSQHAGKAALP